MKIFQTASEEFSERSIVQTLSGQSAGRKLQTLSAQLNLTGKVDELHRRATLPLSVTLTRMPTKKSVPLTQKLLAGESVENRILLIRGQKVMIDSDLAELYRVTTKRLNQQVNRNRERFPTDFMFQLTAQEKAEVVANCNHLQRLKFSPVLPKVFTEHGAVMLASVLNSPTAIEASIQVVRAFVRLRSILSAHKELARKLEAFEKKTNARFAIIFELLDPAKPRTTIGFRVRGKK